MEAVDEFVDVHKNSVHQMVEIARRRPDVAIHRNGHTATQKLRFCSEGSASAN